MVQNCQNGQTAVHKRAIRTGKKQSYPFNCLSEINLTDTKIIIRKMEYVVDVYCKAVQGVSLCRRTFYHPVTVTGRNMHATPSLKVVLDS